MGKRRRFIKNTLFGTAGLAIGRIETLLKSNAHIADTNTLLLTRNNSKESMFLSPQGTLAFPGAEGFGAHSRGGRDGKIIVVSNLKDYIPGKDSVIEGSFRAACEAKGPRIVVFEISGNIGLMDHLTIREPYITISGETAPGGGICTKNYGLYIATHDVIMRYIRSRPGDHVGREQTGGKSWAVHAMRIIPGGRSVILDHCSFSWANDEVCSVGGEGITDITVQWCIISESLNWSTHPKAPHGYGSLIRSNGNVSFHHNLYALHRSRSPRPGTYGEGSILFDFRNNLMYKGGLGYTAADPVRMNFIGNYHPTTPFAATDSCEYYSRGNTGVISGGIKRQEEFDVAPVSTTSAEEAREMIIENCGAILPERDAVDTRVIGYVKTGKGMLINSADEVGGWPEL